MEAKESVTILREHPASEAARQLIAELDAYLGPLYPAESQHGYSIEKLIEQQVEFFVLFDDGQPAGCAGVQFFDADGPDAPYGELKRMYVRDAFRGRGFGKLLLDHIEGVVVSNGVSMVRLETGIYQPEAVRLYEKGGYHQIPPFRDYPPDDPLSLCYEKRLHLGNSELPGN